VVGIGVIGYGYWGPNLVRNFSEAPNTHVTAICDMRQERLMLAGKRCPGALLTAHVEELISNPDVDAVAISTPVSTHFELAMKALRAGKHVLVEKPVTTCFDDARTLIGEAESRGLVLMVDHTFVYTGAVRKIRDLAENGSLGDLLYYDSTRINLGLFQHDVDVIWDLAVHDFSIMDYVLPARPCAIAATGVSHVSGGTENIAYITAFFENNLIAHINVNWLSPVKVRRTLIGGSKKMVVYDDMEPSEKIKVYDKGITVKNGPESLYKMLVGYRTGDMWAPQVDMAEALRLEAQHFGECIELGKKAITDGYAGLRVVGMLEAATRSMKARGRLIELEHMQASRSEAALV
jgi:predicted dehydrogenase